MTNKIENTHYIKFDRQHDGMRIEAKTLQDINNEVKEHCELRTKLLERYTKNGPELTTEERERFAELEQYIIDNINWNAAEEVGIYGGPFDIQEGVTMLYC